MNIYHNQVTDVCGSVTVRGNIDHASNRVRIRESNKIVMFLWDNRLFLIHIIEVVFVINKKNFFKHLPIPPMPRAGPE